MKNKVISIIFYIVSILLLGVYIKVEISSNVFMSEFGRLFLLCSSCLLLYFGGLFLSKQRKDNKSMIVNLWIFFILYCVLLITLTLFDPMWGRGGLNFNWTKENFKYYMSNSINLIPFKTIIGYTKSIFTSLINTKNIFFNLFGNVVCLMPLAFFIPLLFKKINNTKRFVLSILCITISIELIQFITFTGSCDIDDVILNTLGAIIMYRILNIQNVKNLINNIFLLEKNKIEMKKILNVIIIVFIIIILCLSLYKIGTKYFDNNLNDWVSKRDYKIEIIDETEICDTALEKFYENELYEYYFGCIKSDYVYAKINDGQKYLVKDLLNNNPTDYIISISRFEAAGLDFITKEKYKKIEFNFKNNVYLNNEKVEDETVLKIKWGSSTQSESESSYEMFLIPEKPGKTTLSLGIYNTNSEELIETIKYEISIDNNLEVSYEKFD